MNALVNPLATTFHNKCRFFPGFVILSDLLE